MGAVLHAWWSCCDIITWGINMKERLILNKKFVEELFWQTKEIFIVNVKSFLIKTWEIFWKERENEFYDCARNNLQLHNFQFYICQLAPFAIQSMKNFILKSIKTYLFGNKYFINIYLNVRFKTSYKLKC